MTETAEWRRRTAVVLASAALVLAAVAAIVVWDPVGSVVRAVDLTGLPDVPRWLLWALGKVKFAVIGIIVLVALARELRRRRGA
jgi:hypothetical protein